MKQKVILIFGLWMFSTLMPLSLQSMFVPNIVSLQNGWELDLGSVHDHIEEVWVPFLHCYTPNALLTTGDFKSCEQEIPGKSPCQIQNLEDWKEFGAYLIYPSV